MLFIGDFQMVPIFSPGLNRHDKLVEHHLAERIGRAQPTRNHAHRHVAVARKRSLDYRKIKLHGANRKATKFAGHVVDSVPVGSTESIASPSAAVISRSTVSFCSIEPRDLNASTADRSGY